MFSVKDLTFVLATKSHQHLGVLTNIDTQSVDIVANMNSADELSFDVYKIANGNTEALWDDIVPLKLVYIPELEEYFQIDPDLKDNNYGTIKTLTATSQCEAELSQIIVRNLNINNENDINWQEDDDDWTDNVTFFYHPNAPQYSLLNRLLEKAPHYSIGHVDESLMNIQRQFSFDGTDIYSILTGEVAEQFNCIFIFDSINRMINAYDLYSTCQQCGYRGEFTEEGLCPECGSDRRTYYGDDTTIYVDKENLTEEIQLETDTDSIKNCFKLEAGDDVMTAAVIAQNPNGSPYIYYLSGETLRDMPGELVTKLEQYNREYEYYQKEANISLNVGEINQVILRYKDNYNQQYSDDNERELSTISSPIVGYPNLLLAEYTAQDLYYYVKSGMMPKRETADISATTEAQKLTASNLSPMALSSVTDFTSKETVESSLKNYAKVYVKSGYVKVTPITSSLSDGVQTDTQGHNYKTWTGVFKVTSYSDEDDVKYSCSSGVVDSQDAALQRPISIKVYDDYDEFMKQKILKSIKSDDDDDNTVFDILDFVIYNDDYSINETKVTQFINAVNLYSQTRVLSFKDAFQTALDVLLEAGQSDHPLYKIYYRKMRECQNIADSKSADIRMINSFLEQIGNKRKEIQKLLNFESYLGTDLFKIFSMYRREDEYKNDNFISDARSDAKIFSLAQQFLEEANKQLRIAATPQHSISSNFYNLLNIPEFQPLRKHFKLGNFLRAKVDDSIYRLRLIKWELSGSNDKELNVDFSDMTYAPGVASDLKHLLDSANSMTTSYNYVMKQAEEGNKARTYIDDMIQDGLNSALININNNNNQEVTIDQHGIVARQYDPDTETYSPEQIRITGNVLAFTTDNWESIETALGKANFAYYDKQLDQWYEEEEYGLITKYVLAGQIAGSTIVGGEIYSDNYSSSDNTGCYINLENGDFSLAGGIITFDSATHTFKFDTLNTGVASSDDITHINDRIDNIEIDASGNKTYTGDAVPTLSNYPARDWEDNFSRHVGDLYICTGEADGDVIYRFDLTENGYEWVLVEGAKPESSLTVQIDSSNGNIFKGNNINTILTCHVYYGTQEVTDRVTKFNWIKINQDGEIDTTWSRMSTSAITISEADVWSKANFKCEVEVNL